MPWPVYTERFLLIDNSTASWSWVVPSGKRAVVTAVAITPSSSAVTTGWVSVKGIVGVKAQVQAGAASFALSTRLVAYAGETLSAVMNALGAQMFVGGYLFDTGAQVADEPPEALEGPPPAWATAEDEFLQVVDLQNRWTRA